MDILLDWRWEMTTLPAESGFADEWVGHLSVYSKDPQLDEQQIHNQEMKLLQELPYRLNSQYAGNS